jgi:MoaA/NifB/PqqE/SkfB family radical SAM enzyme
MPLKLPPAICFRVTRLCNACCGFCLAPPDGSHADGATLKHRLDWLLTQGVKTIHFCGGEPTIHPALPPLLEYVHARGGNSRVTTNAIEISDVLLQNFRRRCTQVKVSLHGNREHHNRMVGRDVFDQTTDNLRRLLAAGVPTSVQTTVTAGAIEVVDWVCRFCQETGVRRLTILPFLPRGRGHGLRSDYGLSSPQRRELRDLVIRKRRALNGRLDVRWSDFTARPIPVVEANGGIILEGATEVMDKLLGHIPMGSPEF